MKAWGLLALAGFALASYGETTTATVQGLPTTPETELEAAKPIELADNGTTVSATAPAVTTTLPSVAPTAPGPVITGNIDIRPSVQTSDGFAYSEDAMEFGVRFAPGRQLTYVQTFYTAEPGKELNVLKLTTSPGFIRAKVPNIATLPGGVTVSYEERTYLPTWEYDRDRGQIASFRNYFKFNKDFSPLFSLTFMELPVFHIFSKPGNNTSANPAFENRFYLVATFNITDKITAYFPVMFHATRNRDGYAADPTYSGNWSYFAWINPEIYYQVMPNLSLGAGYYSGNMVAKDLSKITIEDGLKNGVVQFFANVSL